MYQYISAGDNVFENNTYVQNRNSDFSIVALHTYMHMVTICIGERGNGTSSVTQMFLNYTICDALCTLMLAQACNVVHGDEIMILNLKQQNVSYCLSCTYIPQV